MKSQAKCLSWVKKGPDRPQPRDWQCIVHVIFMIFLQELGVQSAILLRGSFKCSALFLAGNGASQCVHTITHTCVGLCFLKHVFTYKWTCPCWISTCDFHWQCPYFAAFACSSASLSDLNNIYIRKLLYVKMILCSIWRHEITALRDTRSKLSSTICKWAH